MRFIRTILVASVFAAFVGCGSDENVSQATGKDDGLQGNSEKYTTVETLNDRGKCNSKKNGMVYYVELEEEYFVCLNSKWISIDDDELDDVDDSSEDDDSEEKSSSSAKRSSSSKKQSSVIDDEGSEGDDDGEVSESGAESSADAEEVEELKSSSSRRRSSSSVADDSEDVGGEGIESSASSSSKVDSVSKPWEGKLVAILLTEGAHWSGDNGWGDQSSTTGSAGVYAFKILKAGEYMLSAEYWLHYGAYIGTYFNGESDEDKYGTNERDESRYNLFYFEPVYFDVGTTFYVWTGGKIGYHIWIYYGEDRRLVADYDDVVGELYVTESEEEFESI